MTNVEAWELWNEPDLTWDTAAAGDFNADEVYVPGIETSYIAKLERAVVELANRAFWNEYGTVNGLVVNDNRPSSPPSAPRSASAPARTPSAWPRAPRSSRAAPASPNWTTSS